MNETIEYREELENKIKTNLKELISNTKHQELKEYLIDFFELIDSGIYMNLNIEHQTLLNLMIYLVNEDFSIKGWELYEIPISNTYVFYNREMNKMFDLVVLPDFSIVPQYISDGNEIFAKNINEAIGNYQL